MKKDTAYKEGFIDGVEPLEEKFDKMGRDIDNIYSNINEKLQTEYEIQEYINDDFNNRISLQEKKSLFAMNTPFDIKDEEVLDKNEQEYLFRYLMTLAEMDHISDRQQRFLVSIAKYLEIKIEHEIVNLENVENIQKVSGQQAFLQTVYEFLYLKNVKFDFLEKYENELACFSVAPRKREDIKQRIEKIQAILGAEGIVEKYGFVSKDEEQCSSNWNEAQLEEECEIASVKVKEISKECADRVNTKDYLELNAYLVCASSEICSNKLIRVDKETGEEVEIKFKRNINFGFDFRDTICCNGTRIFIKPSPKEGREYIYVYNIENFEETKIEYIGDKDYDSYCAWMQANDTHVAYRASLKGEEVVVCYDLEQRSVVLRDNLDIMQGQIVLMNDNLVYWRRNEDKCECVAVNVTDGTITELEARDATRWGAHLLMLNDHFLHGDIYVTKKIIYSSGYNHMSTADKREIFYYLPERASTIQKYVIPHSGEVAVFGKQEKIYYLTIDAEMSLFSYDFITQEHKMVRAHVPAVGSYKKGVLKKQTVYTHARANIVGKWLYYNKDLYGELRWICLE